MNDELDKKEFWTARGEMQQNGGSDDYHLELIERRLILTKLMKPGKVLEIGSGEGALLAEIHNLGATEIVGIDFSPTFIKRLKIKFQNFKNIRIIEMDISNIDSFFKQAAFNNIVSKRTLINLDDFKSQLGVIVKLSNLLLPGGKLILLENFDSGLAELNVLRKAWGLKEMFRPWHNRYFADEEKEIIESETSLRLILDESVASTYYLLSRVLNAKGALETGTEPSYDSKINFAAHNLPNIGHVGAPRLLVFENTDDS